ncbi:patatin-like phospholipase family protein [Chitinimonas lacunae]|uniref:Patatin-like phospholipase family protein n=1 Tax=Chitinimonas lacunae TaxID=1963018 RepID=A0ABV8MQ81_9NEIS
MLSSSSRGSGNALVIGGGAPNSTYMAGALAAFAAAGVEFDVISASGAGALIGLLYLAPRRADPLSALAATVDFGVADPIYRLFPVNYKVFHKPGALAEQFRACLPPRWPLWPGYGEEWLHLCNDWLQLSLSSWCPSDLGWHSQGMCAHVPFVADVVDFDRLRESRTRFYLHAFNLTRRQMVLWDQHQLDERRFRAAMSYPFLYPPYRLDGELYYEGAAFECLNYRGVLAALDDGLAIDNIVVLDVLGHTKLLREPRNLWDAYVLSIVAPLVFTAQRDTELFDLRHNRDRHGRRLRQLIEVPFVASEEQCREALDWNRDNLRRLYQLGYEAGLACAARHGEALGLGPAPGQAEVQPLALA